MKFRTLTSYVWFLVQWLFAIPCVFIAMLGICVLVIAFNLPRAGYQVIKKLYQERKGVFEFLFNIKKYI
jgi:hypothetical protein